MKDSEVHIYPDNWDDLDVWLYSNFRIIPGACSSIESVKYQVARLVAEKLLQFPDKFV